MKVKDGRRTLRFTSVMPTVSLKAHYDGKTMTAWLSLVIGFAAVAVIASLGLWSAPRDRNERLGELEEKRSRRRNEVRDAVAETLHEAPRTVAR